MAQKYAAKNLNVQCMMACLVAALEFQLHIILRSLGPLVSPAAKLFLHCIQICLQVLYTILNGSL